ncbi:MAG: sulfotransferase [Bacteroidetes bacterium]|nr:sulfotransferase [Bacteroidota bacterium]
MKVVHTESSPVFLIGHGSSGTSISAILLDKYSQVCFGTESQFMIRFFNRLSKYGDLSDNSNLTRLVSDILRERWFERVKKFGFTTSLDEILENIGEKSYRGVLDSIFTLLKTHKKMDRWGDKTPEYLYDLPVLHQLYPEAQYIHVVRDGRDVALSEFGRYFGEKNTYKAAVEWRDTILLVKDFLKGLPPNRFIEIRYEDLLAEPAEVFHMLTKFLKIKDEDGQLKKYIDDTISNEIDANNSFKWKSKLSESKNRVFEQVACDILKSYRYETSIETVQDFSPAMKVIWNVDNILKKWKTPGYWGNNAYRAKIRVREMISNFGG